MSTHRRQPATTCRRKEIEKKRRELGASVRKERQKRGLSATTLALLAGISVRTLEGLERGERPPDLDTLLQVLEALELQLWAVQRARVPGVVRVQRRFAPEASP